MWKDNVPKVPFVPITCHERAVKSLISGVGMSRGIGPALCIIAFLVPTTSAIVCQWSEGCYLKDYCDLNAVEG